MRGRRRRTGRVTSATVIFRREKPPTPAGSPAKPPQLCCYAECHLSCRRVGPIWGHGDASVRRALAELTRQCDCPAEMHRLRYVEGKRLLYRAVRGAR